jgi:hypothetical protein
MAQSQTLPCGTDYIDNCFSSAVISACGDIASTSCYCATTAEIAIASLVGPCLYSSCPITQIIAIGGMATSFCNSWQSTHLLTTTARDTGYASSITNPPSITTSLPTTTTNGAASQGLPVRADVGIGLGAFAFACVVAVFVFFSIRRRRRTKERIPEEHELQTYVNISELPDKSDTLEEARVVKIPPQELEAFVFPFQRDQTAPVEADSQSVGAQSRGKVAGTETTAFSFESQKVLLTSGLHDQSRASSVAPRPSSGSIRRHNTNT